MTTIKKLEHATAYEAAAPMAGGAGEHNFAISNQHTALLLRRLADQIDAEELLPQSLETKQVVTIDDFPLSTLTFVYVSKARIKK